MLRNGTWREQCPYGHVQLSSSRSSDRTGNEVLPLFRTCDLFKSIVSLTHQYIGFDFKDQESVSRLTILFCSYTLAYKRRKPSNQVGEFQCFCTNLSSSCSSRSDYCEWTINILEKTFEILATPLPFLLNLWALLKWHTQAGRKEWREGGGTGWMIFIWKRKNDSSITLESKEAAATRPPQHTQHELPDTHTPQYATVTVY